MTPMVQFLSKAASSNGWHYESLRGGWMHRLHDADATHYIIGYTFPHNSAVAARIAQDKVATSLVLEISAVPSVPHALVNTKGVDVGTARRIRRAALAVAELSANGVVVKPVTGSDGRDVVAVSTTRQGMRALRRIHASHGGLAAISPYLPIEREIRVIVLDGHALLAFEKLRMDDWRHNLAFGAQPMALPLSDNPRLVALASAAIDALDLRLAAVDIVALSSQELAVLEINDGIKLDTFAQYSTEYWNIAASVYDRIVSTIRHH
jgi:glutathione synthase/RimK-type ligase-like ATP-grasp enzyme